MSADDHPFSRLKKSELMEIIIADESSDDDRRNALAELFGRDLETARLWMAMLDEGDDARHIEKVSDREDLTPEQVAEIISEGVDLASVVRTLQEVFREPEKLPTHLVQEPISDTGEEPPPTPEDRFLGQILSLFVEFQYAGHRINDLQAFLQELGSLMMMSMISHEESNETEGPEKPQGIN